MRNGCKDGRNRYVRGDAARSMTASPSRGAIAPASGVGRRVAAIALVLLLAGATFALLRDHIHPGSRSPLHEKLEVAILMNDGGPASWDAEELKLRNSGEESVPGVARVMIVPQLKAKGEGGQTFGLGGDLGLLREPSSEAPTILVMGDLTFYFAENWAEKWFYRDGYFYYRNTLRPGEMTTPLLEKVALSKDSAATRRKYADIVIRVEIMADILQADGGAPEAVWRIHAADGLVTPLAQQPGSGI